MYDLSLSLVMLLFGVLMLIFIGDYSNMAGGFLKVCLVLCLMMYSSFIKIDDIL